MQSKESGIKANEEGLYFIGGKMFQIGTTIIHSGKVARYPMGENMARFYRVALPTGKKDLEMAKWLDSIKIDAVVCSGSEEKCHNVGRLDG